MTKDLSLRPNELKTAKETKKSQIYYNIPTKDLKELKTDAMVR